MRHNVLLPILAMALIAPLGSSFTASACSEGIQANCLPTPGSLSIELECNLPNYPAYLANTTCSGTATGGIVTPTSLQSGTDPGIVTCSLCTVTSDSITYWEDCPGTWGLPVPPSVGQAYGTLFIRGSGIHRGSLEPFVLSVPIFWISRGHALVILTGTINGQASALTWLSTHQSAQDTIGSAGPGAMLPMGVPGNCETPLVGPPLTVFIPSITIGA